MLTPDEARLLLDSVDVGENSGLRDRALLAVILYSFARVSAVVGMNVEGLLPARQTLVGTAA